MEQALAQAGENLTRRYRREESVARVRYIKALRAEGKTVPEVKALLSRQAETQTPEE